MPPRYAYWTILIDDKPTAFRAREQEELLPTLHQLRRTNKDVVLKWFARGRLWETPEAAEAASRAAAPPREKRGHDWRPGGVHKDPRDRFKKGGKRRDRGPGRTRAARGARHRLASQPGHVRPRGAPPAGSQPWRDKPRGAPPGAQPWRDKPRGAPPGAQPWRDNPPRSRVPWTEPVARQTRRAALRCSTLARQTPRRPPGAQPWRDYPPQAPSPEDRALARQTARRSARRCPALARQTPRRSPGWPAVARQTRRAASRGGRPWRDRPKAPASGAAPSRPPTRSSGQLG